MPWTFESTVSPERQTAMLRLRTFDHVLSLIDSGPLELLSLETKGQGQCAGAKRVLAVIQVGPAAYDAFLNSPVGLRAQYAESPEAGEDANRRVVEGLQPRLLAHPTLAELSIDDQELARESITSTEARVWVNDRDWSSDDQPGLRYDRWMAKADAAKHGTTAEQHARGLALNGVLAPRGSALEFKGGWLYKAGQPCVDGQKANRAVLIHRYGCV